MPLGRSLERAAFVLLLAATLAPLTGGAAYPWSLFALRALTVTGLVLALLAAGAAGRLELPPLPLLLPLSLYVGLSALSAARSAYLFGSAQEALTIFIYAGGFVLASSLAITPKRRRLLLTGLVAVAGLMSVYGLLQWFGLGRLPQALPGRLSSTYYNPNHYGGLLDLLLPFVLSLLLHAKTPLVRIGYGLLITLLLANLALTFSRGAWLAVFLAAGGLLIWSARNLSRAQRKAFFRVGLAGVFLAALLVSAGVLYAPREAGYGLRWRAAALLDLRHDPNIAGRWLIARSSLNVISEHPWLGVGPGNLVYALPEHRPAVIETAAQAQLHGFVNYAHNDYLQVASESGLPALLAFVGFWLLVLARPSPLPLAPRWGLKAGLAALLVHGLVDGNLTVVPVNAFLAYVAAGALHGAAEDPDGHVQR